MKTVASRPPSNQLKYVKITRSVQVTIKTKQNKIELVYKSFSTKLKSLQSERFKALVAIKKSSSFQQFFQVENNQYEANCSSAVLVSAGLLRRENDRGHPRGLMVSFHECLTQ